MWHHVKWKKRRFVGEALNGALQHVSHPTIDTVSAAPNEDKGVGVLARAPALKIFYVPRLYGLQFGVLRIDARKFARIGRL